MHKFNHNCMLSDLGSVVSGLMPMHKRPNFRLSAEISLATHVKSCPRHVAVRRLPDLNFISSNTCESSPTGGGVPHACWRATRETPPAQVSSPTGRRRPSAFYKNMQIVGNRQLWAVCRTAGAKWNAWIKCVSIINKPHDCGHFRWNESTGESWRV